MMHRLNLLAIGIDAIDAKMKKKFDFKSFFFYILEKRTDFEV